MQNDFKTFQDSRKKDKVMYFVQYYSPLTLTWQEIRKTYQTKQEAENAAFSYGDKKVRIVEYINGDRTYLPVN